MTTGIALAGTLSLQPTDNARPTPIPLAFSLIYSQSSMLELSYGGAQTNVLIPRGTITAPKMIYVEVDTGEFRLTYDAAGTFPWVIAANPAPGAVDPAIALVSSFNLTAGGLYLTTPGPATGKIWMFS